jgi:uncharacterized protein YjiS (DUF1127 family)
MNLPTTSWPAGSADGCTGPLAPDATQQPRAPSWLGRLLSDWVWRVRGRAELRRLSARQLRDIGLTEDQLAHELAKPFWRA